MRTRIACVVLILALAHLPALAQPLATESLAGTSLSIAPGASYDSAVLQIAGPEGYRLDRRFEASAPILVDLVVDGKMSTPGIAGRELARDEGIESPPDGRYRYDLTMTDAAGELQQVSGQFFVENGAAVSRQAKREELGAVRADLNQVAAAGGYTSASEAYAAQDWMYITDSADDGLTHLTLDSDDSGSTILELWGVVNDQGNFSIQECGSNLPDAGCQFTTMFFPDDSGGKIGFGTTAPQGSSQIHMRGPTSGLMLLEEADTSTGFWVGPWNGDFLVDSVTGNGFLVVDDVTGHVGVAVNPPLASLHVTSHFQNGTAKLLVTEENSTVTGRTLFELQNNGNVQFFFQNTDSGDLWQMSQLASVFQISTPSGSGKFRVRRGGGLQALNGSTEIMALNSTGDLTVKSVTQTSSKQEKRGFESVDAVSVLEKVAGLPISEWSYKADGPSVRHVGPMSEDFHAAFGLGKTDKGLTSIDTSGVALAAIQGLVQENKRLEERIADLEEMVQALAEH